MKYIVIADFTAPEGRDGKARVGDRIEIPSLGRAKDLIRYGVILPEDAVAKPSTVAGPVQRSPSSRPARRSRARNAPKPPEDVTTPSPSTTAGDVEDLNRPWCTRVTVLGGIVTTDMSEDDAGPKTP